MGLRSFDAECSLPAKATTPADGPEGEMSPPASTIKATVESDARVTASIMIVHLGISVGAFGSAPRAKHQWTKAPLLARHLKFVIHSCRDDRHKLLICGFGLGVIEVLRTLTLEAPEGVLAC